MSTLALDIRDLHLSLGGRPVLLGIDLRIEAGEFVALAGPNGSGKSSLLRCIAGLLPARRGTIDICGHVIASDTEAAYRRGDLLEKRKVLMADWAKFITGGA